jgi:predicted O-linked N-acetylglucosamine transferase (SPINDLY family)
LAQVRDQRGKAALEHCRILLANHPDWPGSHAAHGEALLSVSEYEAALTEFDWVAERLPGEALPHLKRGLALSALGRFDEAQAAFGTARAIDAKFVEGFCRELSLDREVPEDLDPRSIFLWRCHLAFRHCDWSGWDRYLNEFRSAIRDPAARLDRGLAYAALQTPLDSADRLALARKVASAIEARVPPLPPRPPRASVRKLRIGVLSAGFREHVDALLLLPLFELIDRRRIDLYAYSLSPDDRSTVRDRFRRSATQFRDLASLRNLSAAQQIRRDGIDILVDTGGQGDGARFEITAARPAPVQVQYLCFPGTSGSGRLDYAILDMVVAPPGEFPHWSERVVHLPDTYFLYDFREAPPRIPVARSDYGLPEHASVLCAFHKGEKVDPDSFALWCRVLEEAPGSVLWLLADRPEVPPNLRRAAAAHGIAPERLVFAGREERERYLARFTLADLFVDAIHHNAIVTACDALLMGLPVLTLHGATCSSLSAESLLRAAGLPEMVATDAADYVRRAATLLGQASKLAALREKVSEVRRRHLPLFDTEGRVRQLEAAFTEMWRRHAAGDPPGAFHVRHAVTTKADFDAKMGS